jgi:hypothetical protein
MRSSDTIATTTSLKRQDLKEHGNGRMRRNVCFRILQFLRHCSPQQLSQSPHLREREGARARERERFMGERARARTCASERTRESAREREKERGRE